MSRKKELRSAAPRPGKADKNETLDFTALPPACTTIALPENTSSTRTLDFGGHYGHHCDAVVYAAQRTLERMTQASVASGGKTLSVATIGAYFHSGLAAFLPFLASIATTWGRELRLDDIDRHIIDLFLYHLRDKGIARSTQRSYYNNTKSVLFAMVRSGWIAPDIFPRNPFPYGHRSYKGQRALSELERKHVLDALKIDIRSIIDGGGPLTSAELTVCLLAIAARTGINPTPAMELLTDCLQPHPLKPDRYVLTSFKRRGNNTHIQSLRRPLDVETMVSALPDVARIIHLVIERNAGPRLASDWPERLFVYQRRARNSVTKQSCLGRVSLTNGVSQFVDRHNLTDADGERLVLNLSRLRKTFTNRLFTLSGQDPFLTARLGGHTPKVSNDHYLEASESDVRNWRLMGEIRTDALLNQISVNPVPVETTPVAQCRDTVNGGFAPKNGEHCQKFLNCFRCRSFVVTGDDLHRVFSLYWMLLGMRNSMGRSAWKRVYGHIIRIIDRDIAQKFDAELVAVQRERARVDPHPFWSTPELLEGVE